MKSFSFFCGAVCFSGGLFLTGVISGCGGGSGGSSSGGSGTPSGVNAITFVSNRDGNAEIYAMTSSGGNQTRLTNSPGSDGQPNKSRNGQRIVFESDRDGNSEIYIMNADGSDLQRLTSDSGEFAPDDTQPVFSPDGNTIAWTSTRDHSDGDTDIWLMDVTGANQRRFVTSATGQGSFNPVFSPDGTRIAYFALGVRQRYRDETLSFKNVASGAVTKTNVVTHISRHPRFSPDGSKIVYADQVPNSNLGRIRIFDVASQADTAGPGLGADSINESPDYSPDGNSIIWSVSSGGINGNLPKGQIYVASPDGSNLRVLTSVSTNSTPDW